MEGWELEKRRKSPDLDPDPPRFDSTHFPSLCNTYPPTNTFALPSQLEIHLKGKIRRVIEDSEEILCNMHVGVAEDDWRFRC